MYREVTMIEVREVLRLRGEGLPKKRIAVQLGLDPKTVRRYLTAAAMAGVRVTAAIGDEDVRQVLLAAAPDGRSPARDGWARCLDQRASLERWLGDGLRLTKIRNCWSGRASTSRIPRCIGSRSWSCSLAKRHRRSRCSMTSRARSCSSIRAGWAGSRCPSENGDGSCLDLYRGAQCLSLWSVQFVRSASMANGLAFAPRGRSSCRPKQWRSSSSRTSSRSPPPRDPRCRSHALPPPRESSSRGSKRSSMRSHGADRHLRQSVSRV